MNTWLRPALPTLVEIDAGNIECATSGHDWSPTGLYQNGVACVPCRREGCEAEMRQHPGGDVEIRPFGMGTYVGDMHLKLEDDPAGGVSKIVCREIAQTYRLADIPFKAGDVAVDIGAHVGAVSIYLARKWPDARIVALEPSQANYDRLRRNLVANKVGNVTAAQLAVTGDGRDVMLSGRPDWNSGGLSIYRLKIEDDTVYGAEMVGSVMLDSIFALYGIDRIHLLKLDCEGAEYEILRASEHLLAQVDWLVAEIHTSDRLTAEGNTVESLVQLVTQHIPAERCRISVSGVD